MKIARTFAGALAGLVAWSTGGSAQNLAGAPADRLTMDRLVVTATGWETPVAQTAPSISVIDGAELERKQVISVADALREVPGVDVVESGSRGGQVSLFLRGADPDQVLVLIDGIEVNSTTAGSFDFSDLTPENIERIEVLRGYGGTLYGSEAIGGVIQIFTRRGDGPPRGSISASGGSGFTDREVAEVSGRSGIFAYSASASHVRTEGFQPENDDYENTVVSARVDADVLDDAVVRGFLRVGESEFGNFWSNNFLAAPDPDARQEDGRILARGEWSHRVTPQIPYRVGVSYSRDDLEFRDRPDDAETASFDSDFLAEVFSVDGQTSLSWLADSARTILGAEFESRSGDVDSVFSDPEFGEFPSDYDETIQDVSGYALQQLLLDGQRLVLTGGVRVDDNDRFGRELSPSGGISYQIEATATRLRATYAEGFKAPSLNELFFPGFGNPDLDAETSREVSGGFDQSLLGDRLAVSSSYFHREVEDLIQGVPQDSGLLLAENVGEATIDGVEADLSVSIVPGLRAGGQYAFLDIDADASGRVRRPKHRGSVSISAERGEIWKGGDRFVADVRLLLVGDREDFDPEAFFAVGRNPAYQRADLALSYSMPVTCRWLSRFGVFARLENLFDRDYEEALGFEARPVNVIAGVRAEL